MWLRPLALAVVALGIVADHGRVLLDSTGQCIIRSNGPLFDRFGNAAGLPFLDPFFCLLLGFFREILIYPAGRACCLLFISFALPFLLNLLWRARTRSQIVRAFLLASIGQIITFGATVSLFYSSTEVPSVRDPVKSSKEYAYLIKRTRPSVSRKYVLWIVFIIILTLSTFVGLLLTPTENDAVYIYANGVFQLYPVVFLLALLAAPLRKNRSLTGRTASYQERAAGVRLIVTLFTIVSWFSALLWWAGIVALVLEPAVTSEAAHGVHNESISPIIASVLAGKWKWAAPSLDGVKGGPLFFVADMISAILAAWSSQMESGHAPSIPLAILFGPSFAIARSMAATWADAL